MLQKKYKRVIQLELNEISFPIIQNMITQNELPNFKYINENWSYLKTKSETEYNRIEPWVQWVTAHTGKTFNEHQIFNLGDAHKLEHPQIWEVLSENNIESGIIGSMNVLRRETKGGIFFPDPWSIMGDVYPENLKPIWTLISRRVQAHATSKTTVGDLVKGMEACLRFRIPLHIYAKIAGQVIQQKMESKVKWRLAIIFDLFQAELFKYIVKTTNFGYYTLFLNAIAHYQHHYWRNYSKDGFDPSIVYDDIRKQDDPISYGYKLYDKIVGDVVKMAKNDPDTLVVIASALSQVPYTDKEEQGGMNYYRLIDHKQFAHKIGLSEEDGYQIYPMMSRDWQIKYNTEAAKQKALNILHNLTVKGEPLFNVREDVESFIFIETNFTKGIEKNDLIVDNQGDKVATFLEEFTNIAIKSGHHTGIGNLWMSDKNLKDYSFGKKIELTDLYHHTLSALGVDKEIQAMVKG